MWHLAEVASERNKGVEAHIAQLREVGGERASIPCCYCRGTVLRVFVMQDAVGPCVWNRCWCGRTSVLSLY